MRRRPCCACTHARANSKVALAARTGHLPPIQRAEHQHLAGHLGQAFLDVGCLGVHDLGALGEVLGGQRLARDRHAAARSVAVVAIAGKLGQVVQRALRLGLGRTRVPSCVHSTCGSAVRWSRGVVFFFFSRAAVSHHVAASAARVPEALRKGSRKNVRRRARRRRHPYRSRRSGRRSAARRRRPQRRRRPSRRGTFCATKDQRAPLSAEGKGQGGRRRRTCTSMACACACSFLFPCCRSCEHVSHSARARIDEQRSSWCARSGERTKPEGGGGARCRGSAPAGTTYCRSRKRAREQCGKAETNRAPRGIRSM